MTTRFKLIAATLGLVVAASAIGDVSAKTIERTAPHKTIVVGHHPHHVFGTRLFGHVRLAHRLPLRSKVVIVRRAVPAPALVKTVVARPVIGTTIRGRIVRLGTFGRAKVVHVGTRLQLAKMHLAKMHLAKRPLIEKHAMNHRAGRATIIR